jgi:hypothetical protein
LVGGSRIFVEFHNQRNARLKKLFAILGSILVDSITRVSAACAVRVDRFSEKSAFCNRRAVAAVWFSVNGRTCDTAPRFSPSKTAGKWRSGVRSHYDAIDALAGGRDKAGNHWLCRGRQWDAGSAGEH